MPTLEEFNKLMMQEDQDRATIEAIQKQSKKAVAIEMSLIKNDPRWKVYEDHVLLVIASIEEEINRVHAALSSELSLTSDGILKLRTQLHGVTERKKGLTQALSLVHELIEKGELDGNT